MLRPLVLGLPLLGVLACRVEPSGDDELADAGSTDTAIVEGESSGEAGGETGGEASGETDDCITGSLGCVCGEDQSCAVGLECIAGVCEFLGCEPGIYACSCLPDGTCAEDWLVCEAGVCEYSCTLGSAGCECSPDGCAVDLECIEGECWTPSPHPNCGLDEAQGWYACGFAVMYPWSTIDCPLAELVVGAPCPDEPWVFTEGCCDANGNNWWCEGGVLAFDDCSDEP
jgi:hypothetical protein